MLTEANKAMEVDPLAVHGKANHTIQSTLSASVFQIAISEIKRLGNSSDKMLMKIS